MTLLPVATTATSMNYFLLAVVAIAWTIAFLFLALRFFFTVPVVWGISIGLAALLSAMVALMGGVLRAIMGSKRAGENSESGERAARTFQRSTLAGAAIIAVGGIGQFVSQNGGLGARPALTYLWLGFLVFGLVISLYGEASYLKNRG